MTPLPISVCIISGPEVHRLGRALASVQGWVQEIVVVLNEDVCDGTEDLALGFGAKVYRERWKGFIGQKNSVAQKGTSKWLFGMDADEEVSPGLKHSIVNLFQAGKEPDLAAYRLPRCSLYYGKWIRHGDWYPDYSIRLWKKNAAVWQGHEPHAALKVDGAVGTLRGDLLHYSMETIEHQIQKTVRYAEDFVEQCRKDGREVSFGDLFFRPIFRFVRGYFIKLGFLDGWQGYAVASMTSFYTFLRYLKALEAQGKVRKDEGQPKP